MPDLNAFAAWLISVLLYVPQKIYEMITDSAVSLINSAFTACGAACNFTGINSAFATIPDGVMWVLSWFNVGTGMTMIAAAYTVRFLIRRIPFIG